MSGGCAMAGIWKPARWWSMAIDESDPWIPEGPSFSVPLLCAAHRHTHRHTHTRTAALHCTAFPSVTPEFEVVDVDCFVRWEIPRAEVEGSKTGLKSDRRVARGCGFGRGNGDAEKTERPFVRVLISC